MESKNSFIFQLLKISIKGVLTWYVAALFALLSQRVPCMPFFSIKRARQIWNIMFPSLFSIPINTRISFMDFWLYLIDHLNPDEIGLAAVTCWATWGDRN